MKNFDPNELEKFSQGEWWDESDPTYAMLHRLNPIRMAFIESHLSLKDKKILDLGCGGGILTEALAKAGAETTGIDLNETAIKQAIQHADETQLNIRYHTLAIEKFAEEHPGEFDAITCMEMLEHVPDPESIIQASRSLLKPNGTVFFSTINRSFRSYGEAIIAAEFLLKLLPKGTHDYQKFIKPSELCEAARKAGLTLIDLKGLNYSLFSKNFSLSDKPSVNYLAAFLSPISEPHALASG